MTQVKHSLVALACALAASVLVAPLSTAVHGEAYGEQRFGAEERLDVASGDEVAVTWTWSGEVEWNGSVPSIVLPRIPWAVDVNGTADGPTIEMLTYVNDRLAHRNSFAAVPNSGFGEPIGWPAASEFGTSGLSLGPFLASPGSNTVRVEVAVKYNASGEGRSAVEFGPLFVRIVPVGDLAHLHGDPAAPSLESQRAGRLEAGAALAGPLVLGAALAALSMGRPPRRGSG